jgi:hypothetical protein
MLVCRLAMLVSGLGMGLGVIMLPLFMMMSRLMVVVSRGLMLRRCVLVMLVRGVLRRLSHVTFLIKEIVTGERITGSIGFITSNIDNVRDLTVRREKGKNFLLHSAYGDP